ncbi:hypothetical protein DFH09DRAFT_1077027 [Mycena vulgaris]|nr:hypothetical protein DFH09DRAFT_1077027 [Mycena vulgaris]
MDEIQDPLERPEVKTASSPRTSRDFSGFIQVQDSRPRVTLRSPSICKPSPKTKTPSLNLSTKTTQDLPCSNPFKATGDSDDIPSILVFKLKANVPPQGPSTQKPDSSSIKSSRRTQALQARFFKIPRKIQDTPESRTARARLTARDVCISVRVGFPKNKPCQAKVTSEGGEKSAATKGARLSSNVLGGGTEANGQGHVTPEQPISIKNRSIDFESDSTRLRSPPPLPFVDTNIDIDIRYPCNRKVSRFGFEEADPRTRWVDTVPHDVEGPGGRASTSGLTRGGGSGCGSGTLLYPAISGDASGKEPSQKSHYIVLYPRYLPIRRFNWVYIIHSMFWFVSGSTCASASSEKRSRSAGVQPTPVGDVALLPPPA